MEPSLLPHRDLRLSDDAARREAAHNLHMKPKSGSCKTTDGDGALPEMSEFWSQSFDNLKATLERETELRERAKQIAPH